MTTMLRPRRTFGTPDPQTRRLILSAARANYIPGMAKVGRAAMREYLVEWVGHPAAEIDRIWAAADRLVARGAEATVQGYLDLMDWPTIVRVAKGMPLPHKVTARIEADWGREGGAYRGMCGQVTDACHDAYCEGMAAADFEERAYGRDD